jgi:hypothetical protein
MKRIAFVVSWFYKTFTPFNILVIIFHIYTCDDVTLVNDKSIVSWKYMKSNKKWDFSSRYMFSYHPFYFDFHSARVIFDVSSDFFFWNLNRTPTWHLSKMSKVAFKDVSTKNSEPTYWTILFVMLNIYFIYKVSGKKSRSAI